MVITLRASLTILIAAAVACSGPSDAPGQTSSSDRIEAIRQARVAVEEPAVALGTSSLTLVERVERLATVGADDLETALESAAEAAADLRDAATDASEVEFDRSTADTAEAAAALQTAAVSGEEASVAGDTLVGVLARAAEVDERLAELVAGWEEHGSRRELMDHFAGLAEDADQLADEVEEQAADQACSAVLELRVRAARSVAAGTRELRELVAEYRGNEYDVRQPELLADPYGEGGMSLLEVSQAAAFCPLVDVIGSTVIEVTGALDRMQQALAPTDL
jgi:hypothetical protein